MSEPAIALGVTLPSMSRREVGLPQTVYPIELSDVLPGFELTAAQLFGRLRR